MPVLKKVNKKFFKKWKPEMAYILGFFSADGSIRVNSRGSHYIDIQCTDKKIIYYIKKTLDAEHKIKERIRGGNENNLYRIQIGSKEMCDDLRKLGFSEQKTCNMVFPNIPKKYIGDFIRGYFDGDGNVWVDIIHKERKTKLLAIKTAFTSCSKLFLEQLKEKLYQMKGTKGSIIQCKGKNCFRLQYSIYDSLKLYDFMYNKSCSSFYLKRKKKVFDKYKNMQR